MELRFPITSELEAHIETVRTIPPIESDTDLIPIDEISQEWVHNANRAAADKVHKSYGDPIQELLSYLRIQVGKVAV